MKIKFKIADRFIGDGEKAFLIAEAGVNHNGDIKIAKNMIETAVKAGVDAIKFQTFKTSEIILKNVKKAPYQQTTTTTNENQFEMLAKLEISKDFHQELIDYCHHKDIIFLSTPYDEKSLDLLLALQVPAIKVASTDTTNLLLLEKIARTGLPVILSTGMSDAAEIIQAYDCLRKNGCLNLAILKCTSNYPTQEEEVNLNSITTLKLIFPETVIGFSDHTVGVGASPYSIALGGKIVEKHFTLNKTMQGPDHRASLSPNELGNWVKEIRKVEKMMGSYRIFPTESEQETKKYLQKYIVSNKDIKKGSVITEDNIIAKRSGGEGIPASFLYEVLNKTANCNINKNMLVQWSLLDK